MQGVVRTCLFLGGLAACHTTSSGTTDAGPSTGDGSSSADQGLVVTWSASVPGSISSDVTVSSLLVRIANLRVIGDAGPGDDRTSVDSLEISWAQGTMPMPLTFANAPSGVYSHVSFLADGNLVDYSYEIKGTAKVDGNVTPFTIHDRSPLPISLDTNTTLEPNQQASLAIIIRLDQPLQSLDWSHLDNNDGTLTLDTFDDGMSDFRSKMIDQVFSTDHPAGRLDP